MTDATSRAATPASSLTVSAIVPVRNAAVDVADAVESILAQTHAVDEIVVVDGGSTDGTRDVVARFAGVRIIAQPDDGLAAARNLGLASTTGTVVAFLDADDRWAAAKTALQLAALAAEPDQGVVAGRMCRIDLDDREAPASAPVPALTPGGFLARRSVFAAVGGFDERYRIACDTEWLMRVQDAGLGTAVLPDVVLQKGIRADRLSADMPRYRAELLQALRARRRRTERTHPMASP